MNQNITIAQLEPNLKGSFTLRFEVVTLQPSPNNPDQIFLHIADQSGCINAYFNNHGKHIKPGNVYELNNLKCKVVDHSLRVQLTKESKITRVKFDMAFKDLVNNLSQKFYVSKAEKQIVSTQKTQAKPEVIRLQQSQKSSSNNSNTLPPQKKQQNGKKQGRKSASQVQDHPTQTQKNYTNDKVEPKQENRNQPKGRVVSQKSENSSSVKEKYQNNYIEKKDHTTDRQEKMQYEKPIKKKYTEKKSESSIKPQSRQREKEMKQSNQRILLKDIYLYQEKDVNLIVQIQTKTIINKGKYILVRSCDLSGATYLEFDSRCHLESKVWYCLKKFTVYGDKTYGFVASQQSYSTYDTLDQYDEVPDHKPIYFPKLK